MEDFFWGKNMVKKRPAKTKAKSLGVKKVRGRKKLGGKAVFQQISAEEPKIIFDSVREFSFGKKLAKMFGFNRTGSSIIGKHARQIIPSDARKLGGMALFLIGSTLIAASFVPKNIGGNISVNPESPTRIIDVSTKNSAQIPMRYVYESRGFSVIHSGADLTGPVGTPVYPIMAGTVEAINTDGFGYGNHVILKHSGGYESLYGHLSQISVSVGQLVGLSTMIGKSGNTGLSTGPHLHLEIRDNGQAINPGELLTGI